MTSFDKEKKQCCLVYLMKLWGFFQVLKRKCSLYTGGTVACEMGDLLTV